VGSFAPNGYGLFDMAGNVLEWVADWYDSEYYAGSPYKNPDGPEDGKNRVLRGGSYYTSGGYLSVGARWNYKPDFASNNYTGFRCVLEP
jgi:formylglycine-generating enzyme required for sulfatase activity